MFQWFEEHQAPLYLAAMGIGMVLSLLASPYWLSVYMELVSPALAVLLGANFLCMPLSGKNTAGTRAQGGRGLLSFILVLNFVAVPLLVAVLIKFTGLGAHPVGLSIALVLLCPCVDYVVVFTRFAGGNYWALLRYTPLILGAQIIVIPLWITLYSLLGILSDGGKMRYISPPPQALAALLVFIIPLFGAYIMQRLTYTVAALKKPGEALISLADKTMVPLTALLLILMCAAYTVHLGRAIHYLPALLGTYTAYALGAVALGAGAVVITSAYGGHSQPTRPDRIALIFSVVTRNSLIIFPIISALSAVLVGAGIVEAELMPAAALTQTLVELIVLIILVRIFRPKRVNRSGNKSRRGSLTGR